MADDMFAGLEEVRKSYLKSLINESEKLLLEAASSSTKETEEQLHIFAHKIYGSGSSYGYDFVTKTGENISIALNRRHDLPGALTLVQSLIKELETTLANFVG
ncbi:MAG: hypothetical protein CVV50_06005 [Spirochaetae bacterium HGW-Spirochaetae-6]|nr:MAG: hypothetical protein CVV50_06005 [Spirochaetae bacterium HGW-Spirochaetae-6]